MLALPHGPSQKVWCRPEPGALQGCGAELRGLSSASMESGQSWRRQHRGKCQPLPSPADCTLTHQGVQTKPAHHLVPGGQGPRGDRTCKHSLGVGATPHVCM